MIDEIFQRQARKVIPKGYYQLTKFETLRTDDLIWDYTASRWLRADSPEWMFDSFSVPMAEIVCAIRKAQLEGFGEVKKVYSVNKEQRSLF